MFSVAVWLQWGRSFWSCAKTSSPSVVLGSCWQPRNVSMTLKIWGFVIWTTDWKLSRWYSLWSSNYANPPLLPLPFFFFLVCFFSSWTPLPSSDSCPGMKLCPLWLIFRAGYNGCGSSLEVYHTFLLIPLSRFCIYVCSSHWVEPSHDKGRTCRICSFKSITSIFI